MAYEQSTELEAVNVILGSIGESPVNSIVNTGLLYVDVAVGILNETSREVQSSGWTFNTEVAYPLTPDVNSALVLPANTLKINTQTFSDLSKVVTRRGSKVYDITNHTTIFSSGAKVDLVLYLPFTDLPESARQYIITKAARRFQARFLGSSELGRFTFQDEQDARVLFISEDVENGGYNMVKDNSSSVIVDRYTTNY